ncbi:MAG TPA: hypothetical protein VLB72_10710 [Burkholderiales bacterium]|nr:hypothetical protein [Burkholderiales bacterium]
MLFRVIAALVALVFLLGFLLPYVMKMKDLALGAVILVGLALMARDLLDTFREKDE